MKDERRTKEALLQELQSLRKRMQIYERAESKRDQAEKVLRKTGFYIFPQELAAEHYADEQRTMHSGEPIVNKEEVVVNKAGTKMWSSTTKIPVCDSQGNIIGLVGMNRDMTERKHAEERLQLLDQILQRVNALVLVADTKGEITYVSPSVKKILGYDPAEVLGDGWWNVSRDDEKERKREKDLVARCARGEISPSAGPYERIVKSRDGVPHYTLWQDTKGPESFIIGVGHDITERKLLEDQLREAQKLDSLGTLVDGIAHDFNNILGIILCYTSMLEGGNVDPKKSSRSIAAINKAVQRGAGLVQQLLTFARKADTLFESVKLNDVIGELADLLKETFPRTIQVSLQLEKDIPSITGDANRLHQALLNLCVNARDAMLNPSIRSTGGTLGIRTESCAGLEVSKRFRSATEEEYICVTVEDTGVGMDKATQERILEPFFTTKPIGKGTGLGLSVVYGIVRSHRGFIEVDSALGRGSTFRIFLPVARRSVQSLGRHEAGQVEVMGGKETILRVEDEELLGAVLIRGGLS
ncbi:MAG: PAS domain S-box protein [Bacteroidota bacterium]